MDGATSSPDAPAVEPRLPPLLGGQEGTNAPPATEQPPESSKPPQAPAGASGGTSKSERTNEPGDVQPKKAAAKKTAKKAAKKKTAKKAAARRTGRKPKTAPPAVASELERVAAEEQQAQELSELERRRAALDSAKRLVLYAQAALRASGRRGFDEDALNAIMRDTYAYMMVSPIAVSPGWALLGTLALNLPGAWSTATDEELATLPGFSAVEAVAQSIAEEIARG